MRISVRDASLAVFFLFASPSGAEPLDRATLERAAEAAARYLVAVEAADGRFLYEFDFLRSTFLQADNIVRQAGAGFVLNQFFEASALPDFAEPSARAIGYYATQSVKRGDGTLISEDRTLEGARAGGTALALLAELVHSRATGSDFRPDLRLSWLKGLAAQQQPSGGIAQRPDETEEDSYATGETWLALAYYADVDPDEATLAPVLERLEAWAMTKYLAEPDNQFAHWGLMAAARRLETTGDPRYLDFIAGFVAPFVRGMRANEERSNRCAALEGLAAAAGALERHGKAGLAAEVRAKLDTELAAQLQLQLTGDRLEFGPGRYYEDPKLKNFAGAFINGAYTLKTRIDSTQHCLSAILHYRRLIAGNHRWQM